MSLVKKRRSMQTHGLTVLIVIRNCHRIYQFFIERSVYYDTLLSWTCNRLNPISHEKLGPKLEPAKINQSIGTIYINGSDNRNYI